jgi:hypothetical protein
MYSSADILAAASAIQPHLADLLGEQARAVNARLDDLLRRGNAGEDVRTAILKLLAAHEPAREWLEDRLDGGGVTRGGDKAYSPLAGDHKPPADVVYECACGNTEFSPKVLATPPLCPNCGQPMKFKV